MYIVWTVIFRAYMDFLHARDLLRRINTFIFVLLHIWPNIVAMQIWLGCKDEAVYFAEILLKCAVQQLGAYKRYFTYRRITWHEHVMMYWLDPMAATVWEIIQ